MIHVVHVIVIPISTYYQQGVPEIGTPHDSAVWLPLLVPYPLALSPYFLLPVCVCTRVCVWECVRVTVRLITSSCALPFCVCSVHIFWSLCMYVREHVFDSLLLCPTLPLFLLAYFVQSMYVYVCVTVSVNERLCGCVHVCPPVPCHFALCTCLLLLSCVKVCVHVCKCDSECKCAWLLCVCMCVCVCERDGRERQKKGWERDTHRDVWACVIVCAFMCACVRVCVIARVHIWTHTYAGTCVYKSACVWRCIDTYKHFYGI